MDRRLTAGSADISPPTNPRFKRGRGRPYTPDVVQRIRVLAEGTALSQAAIAAKAGVAQSTVWRLCQKHGWRRTADTERWKPLVAVDRIGLAAPLAAGYGRVAALAGRERDRLVAEKARIEAAIDAVDTLGQAARRRAALFAGAGRSTTRIVVAPDSGVGPVRLSTGPRRGHAARPVDLVAKARHLVETTVLPQAEIVRRIGISKPTLISWAQNGGWVRPVHAPQPFGFSAATRDRRRERTEARREAHHRMTQAERGLDALEQEERVDVARIDAALRALGAVRSALRRRPLVSGL